MFKGYFTTKIVGEGDWSIRAATFRANGQQVDVWSFRNKLQADRRFGEWTESGWVPEEVFKASKAA